MTESTIAELDASDDVVLNGGYDVVAARRAADLPDPPVPGRADAHTWNAVSNTPMIAVYVAMGFRPVDVSVAWQSDLPSVS